MYRTKVLLEVVVEHQFDPNQGISVITSLLKNPQVPAVKSVTVIGAESNFRLHQPPADELTPIASR